MHPMMKEQQILPARETNVIQQLFVIILTKWIELSKELVANFLIFYLYLNDIIHPRTILSE